MNLRVIFGSFTFALALGLAPQVASAHDAAKNLKVLKDNGETMEKGMKAMSKGLNVKCQACHVKGKFESDDVEAKVKTRDFFTAVVGEADQAKKDAALAELLKVLKLDAAKDAKSVWAGVGMLEKK